MYFRKTETDTKTIQQQKRKQTLQCVIADQAQRSPQTDKKLKQKQSTQAPQWRANSRAPNGCLHKPQNGCSNACQRRMMIAQKQKLHAPLSSAVMHSQLSR